MRKFAYLSTIFMIALGILFPSAASLAQSTDIYFTNLEAKTLPDAEVQLEWSTNDPSFYVLEYGLTTDYTDRIQGTSAKINHSALLRNLESKKTYHFRIIAYTADDRRTVTFDQTFKTKKQIDDEKPELLTFRMPLITDTSAYFYLQTDEKTKTTITYWQQNNPSKKYKKTVSSKNDLWSSGTLTKLKPATTYVYTMLIKDEEGNAISFFEKTFRTETAAFDLGVMEIENITPIDSNAPGIGEEQVTITFTTTLPARCSIANKKQSGGSSTTVQEPNYKTWQHTFTVTSLKPSTAYKYTITCTDFLGKKTTSDAFHYQTAGLVILGYSTNTPTKPFGGKNFTLMRSIESPRVYVVFGMQKYYIKNPDILRAYGLENEPIKTVTQAKLDSYVDTKLVKDTNGTLYYLYLDKNKKKKINSSTVNKSYQFNRNITAIELSDFDLGTYQDITLVKTPNDPAVYYISGTTKRPIASWDVFVYRGWQPWEIGIVNQTDLDSYTTFAPIQ